MSDLNGKTVAILATNGFEQSELAVPQERLRQAGATVHVVSPEGGKIRGWNHTDWGDEFTVDKKLEEVTPDQYDALVLPGGQINPDLLRMNSEAVKFAKDMMESGKPVAAVCHGPWLLVEADVIKGRAVTSYESIKTDVKNAGGDWRDREVVIDRNLITSRKPDDLEAFCGALIDMLGDSGQQARYA